MKISRKNWLIRYAFFDPFRLMEVQIPNYTSTCELFWRCVFLTPLIILSTILLSPFFLIGWVLIKVVCFYYDHIEPRIPKRPEQLQESILKVAWKGFKEKTCPLIEIVKEES